MTVNRDEREKIVTQIQKIHFQMHFNLYVQDHNEAMMLVTNYIKSQKFPSQSLILLMMIGLEAENPSSG